MRGCEGGRELGQHEEMDELEQNIAELRTLVDNWSYCPYSGDDDEESTRCEHARLQELISELLDAGVL